MPTQKIVRTVVDQGDGSFLEKITTVHQEVVKKAIKEVGREEKNGRLFRLPKKGEKPTAKILDDKSFEVRDLVEVSEHVFAEERSTMADKSKKAAAEEKTSKEEELDEEDVAEAEDDEDEADEEEQPEASEDDEDEDVEEDEKAPASERVTSKKKAGRRTKAAKKVEEKKAAKPVKAKKAKPAKVVKKEKPSSGQSGPAIENLPYDKLNKKERKVIDVLAESGKSLSLADVAKAAFTTTPKEKANSWVRNSLRRPVRAGFIEKTDRGEYKITTAGKRCVKKAA